MQLVRTFRKWPKLCEASGPNILMMLAQLANLYVILYSLAENSTGKMHTFINMLGANGHLRQNFRRMLGANGSLHRKFPRMLDTNARLFGTSFKDTNATLAQATPLELVPSGRTGVARRQTPMHSCIYRNTCKLRLICINTQ